MLWRSVECFENTHRSFDRSLRKMGGNFILLYDWLLTFLYAARLCDLGTVLGSHCLDMDRAKGDMEIRSGKPERATNIPCSTYMDRYPLIWNLPLMVHES